MKKLLLPCLIAVSLLTACSGSTSAPGGNSPKRSAAAKSIFSVTQGYNSDPAPGNPMVPFPDLSGYEVTDPFGYEAGEPEVSGDRDTFKNVTFFRDGKKICGEYYIPEGEGPFPVVVISSGQTAPLALYQDEAKAFSENGIACLIFDFIGAVGISRSDGELTDSSVLTEVQDLNVILDSLSYLPEADTEKVFLWGHSLGGLVSTYTGAERPDDICGMILLEPSFVYPDFTRAAEPYLSQVPDVITDPKKYNTIVGRQFVIDMVSVDVLKEAERFGKDVLLILGTTDGKVSSSPSLSVTYPEAFEIAGKTFPSCRTEFVEGADHLFQGEHGKTVIGKTIEFVKEHS